MSLAGGGGGGGWRARACNLRRVGGAERELWLSKGKLRTIEREHYINDESPFFDFKKKK